MRRISTHSKFDAPNYWTFERNSRLPRGYFDEPKLGPDGWVFVICVLLGVLALVLA